MTKKHHIAFDDIVHSLEMNKEATAIIEKNGTSYSYHQLQQMIVGAQEELLKKGVKKGDKILVFVPMSVELYALLEAIFSLGAIALFLDPWMKGKKMSQVIKQVQPDLFVVTKKISRIAWLLPATWNLKKWKIVSLNPSLNSWNITATTDDDNALITFTSGTSGQPKGANRTFGFLHAQSQTLKHHIKGENDEPYIDFTNFPIVGLADFAVGNTVVIPRLNLMKIHKADASQIIQQLNENKVNRLIVSPSLLAKIIYNSDSTVLKHIKHVVTGGAPIPLQLIQHCLLHFPEIHFEAIYGSTEAEPICITTFDEINEKLDNPLKGIYTGKKVEDIELKIIQTQSTPIKSNEFNSLQLQEHEIGEVVVTGDHVNKSYYQNQLASEKNKIVDEEGTIWHRTGDLGYLTKEHLYLVGRDHRIIQAKGQDFHPYPIEQHIQLKFGISDVGYVHHKNIITFFTGDKVDTEAVKNEIIRVGYPCDAVIYYGKPLPRDARHKSKLQIEAL